MAAEAVTSIDAFPSGFAPTRPRASADTVHGQKAYR